MNPAIRYGDIIALCNQEDHQDNAIAITGVTGFLGSHFLFWRLKLPGSVYVFVRAEDQAHAKQRVAHALKVCAESYNLPHVTEQMMEKIHYITSDIDKPLCGVSDEDIARLKAANIQEFWHSAASLAFEEHKKAEIAQSNIDGTGHILDVVKAINANRYIHVSTAYTAGEICGDVKEQLHPVDQKFKNYYEESKNQGEHVVANYCEKHGINWNILRPAIIVGPMLTKRTGGTRFGLYGLAHELYNLRDTLKNVENTLRLEGDVEAVGNLVPVDQVVYDMMYLGYTGFGNQHIYHACGAVDFKIEGIIKRIENLAGFDVVEFAKKREGESSPLETMFDKRTVFYSGYYDTVKRFERSLPAHKPMNWDDVSNYITAYYHELQEIANGRSMERHQLTSYDNLPLTAYSAGDKTKQPIVIVNAIGMPNDIILPLARRLAKTHYVVSWDSRWLPCLTHKFNPEDCHSLTFARDLISVLSYFELEKPLVVGWSSGVQVCLRAMNEFPERIGGSVLLNGGTSIRGDESMGVTDYQMNLMSLLPKIKNNYRMSEMYCDLIYGTKLHEKNEADQGLFTRILTSTDPYLLYMTSMPFRNAEALYRYANVMANLFMEREDAWTTGVKHPVLVYSGKNDTVTHEDAAATIAEKLENGEHYNDENGDHFAHFYQRKVAQIISQFAEKVASGAEPQVTAEKQLSDAEV